MCIAAFTIHAFCCVYYTCNLKNVAILREGPVGLVVVHWTARFDIHYLLEQVGGGDGMLHS